MAPKINFEFSIRKYGPSEEHEVLALFRDGILEHVYPAFFRAMSNVDHLGLTLSISMAGYVLGGSSYFQAFFFGFAWAGLIYSCCHEIYNSYMMRRLNTDMADIESSYLENPDNSFWVAEEHGERFNDWNGGVSGSEIGQDTVDGSFGEVCHLVVAFPWRRKQLGSQLTRKALEFCKERGFTRLALDLSSPQTAAISMYQKLGFVQTASHSNTHTNKWFSKLFYQKFQEQR
uniref:N-acetyltransferase domain-containing protein n=1 Tax=Oryzias latipes TaxID=8090 RepID=A0A3P9H1N0_ORYLA